MLQKLLIALLAIFIIPSCNSNNKNLKEEAINAINAYNGKTSINYDVDYRIKFFDNDDTTILKSNVSIFRDKNDSVVGGVFWVKNHDSLSGNHDMYYDLEHTYYINHDKNEIIRFKNEPPNMGSLDVKMILTGFIEPQNLVKAIRDTQNIVSFSDSNSINGKFIKTTFKIPDNELVKNIVRSYSLNSQNGNVEEIKSTVEMDDQVEFNHWQLSNIKFDNVTPKDLKKQFEKLKETYSTIDYKKPAEGEMAPLENGLKAPTLTGEFYTDNKKFTLEDFKGKIVILDFWYVGCYPCQQAIPHLSKIQEKYRDKGVVVIGINPYDNSEDRKKKIPAFITRTQMNYPIVFVGKSTTTDFKVYGFPTMYIIDKKGKIQFSEIGFNEGLEGKLDNIITKMIK